MGHEDLCSKLQMALLQQQVKFKPVIVSSSAESHKVLQSYDDSRLKFIQSILDDDDDLQHDKLTSDQVLNSKLLRELTEIVYSSSSSSSSSSCSASASSSSASSPSSPPPSCKPQDFENQLMAMAQAVQAKDSAQVYKLAEELTRVIALDKSSPLHRLARYFMNALVARLRGYGAQMCRIMSQEVTKKQVLALEINLPSVRASDFFVNQTILEVCQSAQHIHIVDYGILYGCQWPSLLRALSQRAQGPPKRMMITGVELSRLGEAVMSQASQSLVEYAKSCGIPLQFQAVISDSWEKDGPRYHLCQDQLLIVNCKYRLRHLKDAIAVESPRRVFFRNIARLKPALFTMCAVSADLSSPIFLQRFRETWKNFHVRTEQFHEMMLLRDPERLEFMHSMMEKFVMNVVACEGVDRTERLGSYRTWNSLATKAGFEKVAASEQAIQLAKAVWSGHESLTYAMDEEWLLLGWKHVPLNAMSVWRLQQNSFHQLHSFQTRGTILRVC